MRRIFILAVAVVVTALPLEAQRRGGPPAAPSVDPKVAIAASAKALGVADVASIQYSGSGTTNAFGQASAPNRSWPAFKVTSYTAVIDYTTPAMRVELERTNPDGPVRGGGGLPLVAPQKQVSFFNGRQLPIWTTPHGAIKAAQQADAKDLKFADHVLTFPAAGTTVKATVSLDDTIYKIETVADTPMLGDTLTETYFLNYKIFEGVKFPTHINVRQGGFPILDLAITDVKPNAKVAIEVPAGAQQAAAQPAAVKVDVQKVADGVFYLTGGTHHSVAVEFSDHVIVVEAPQNEERTLAVLDAVKKTIPGKPINAVVNTHNHFDHAGGLRAVVAEGIPIVTHERNAQYYEYVFMLSHTISPDRLARAPKKPTFQTVADKKMLTDGTRQLELLRVSTDHNDVMLIGYLPKEKILIEADLFNPPAENAAAPPLNPVTAAFYDRLQQLKLDVSEILPLHGRLVTMKDLQAAAGKSATH